MRPLDGVSVMKTLFSVDNRRTGSLGVCNTDRVRESLYNTLLFDLLDPGRSPAFYEDPH